MRLRQTDAEAVDLLLDRTAAPQNGSNSQAPMAFHSSISNDRVSAAEKVLNLLRMLPDSDPPDNLSQRTLAFVEHMASEMMQEPLSPKSDRDQPMA